jgi:glycosyltransferase involved in cell wall biosynthesis
MDENNENMNKILTIVVPVYNMEHYLSKCLNSLILKDKDLMNTLEVIIVNDGSKDNSLKIMRIYESNYPNIFYVIDKLNGGHGSACNVGLSLAHGKFIRFLDSDDWLDENNFPLYLERLKHEESQVVETPLIYEYVLKNKTVIVKKRKITYDKTYNINDLEVYKTYDDTNYCVFSIHEDTFRTDILRKYVKFREKAVYDDNILGLVGVFELKKISFYDLPLYHYLNGREGQTMSHKVMVKNFNCVFYQAEDMISIYDTQVSEVKRIDLFNK